MGIKNGVPPVLLLLTKKMYSDSVVGGIAYAVY